VILAAGGQALPKSGSDGYGYTLARALGHTLTPRIFPALVPLTLPRDHWLTALSGVAVDAAIVLHSGAGKLMQRFENALLCTHFGLSGPAVLDISRYYLDAHAQDPAATLSIHWLPDKPAETIDAELLAHGKSSLLRYLTPRLPERLARALCAQAGVEIGQPAHALTREQRRALVHLLSATPLPISGSRGFTYAEVTAGGVPLDEIQLKTMESRMCEGLYLCGELCDVDGRIGGYNFQWAWSSGYVAGISASESLRYTE
jgi:predicted Rossmann fold flavoprotein